MAATAQLLGRCRREARRRGIAMPMPVVQGWYPHEYALCAKWLPLIEWPELVGIGSVCRRALDGPDGILAILEKLIEVTPPHVRFHLFGVKSAAYRVLAGHSRVASVDSMAWDFRARALRRTGRDMDFRIEQLDAWVLQQRDHAAQAPSDLLLARSLFDPGDFGGFDNSEMLVLEALALQYAELLLSDDLEYRDAVHGLKYDGVVAISVLRARGVLDDETLADLDDILAGVGDRIECLQRGRPPTVCSRDPYATLQ